MKKLIQATIAVLFTLVMMCELPVAAVAGQNEVIATIPVGNSPAGVAISPDGGMLAVANLNSGTVSFIEISSNTILFSVAISYPNYLAFSADGSELYVSSSMSSDLRKISIASRVVSNLTPSSNNCSSSSIDLSANGQFLYVVCVDPFTPSIERIQLPGGSFTQTPLSIGFMNQLSFLTVAPDGNYVYATTSDDHLVKIDAQTLNITATATTGNLPQYVITNDDGSRLYVANYNNHNVEVFDSQSMTSVSTISLQNGAEPVALALTPDGSKLLVTEAINNAVEIVDMSNNTVISTITVGGNPSNIVITPNGHFAYVSNYDTNNISVIDLRAPAPAPAPVSPSLPNTGNNPSEIIALISISALALILGWSLIVRRNKSH